MKTYDTTITVPVEDEKVTTDTQYGVRWPNGEISWHMIDGGSNSRHIFFRALAERESTSLSAMNWKTLLDQRADKAKVDREVYESQHTFIKRTIVVAVTRPENV